jgi:hypothetical protein
MWLRPRGTPTKSAPIRCAIDRVVLDDRRSAALYRRGAKSQEMGSVRLSDAVTFHRSMQTIERTRPMPAFQPAATYQTDVADIRAASRRLADDPRAQLSTTERIAASIVNGRLDLLPPGFDDYRSALLQLGAPWAHAVIDVLFDNWNRYMTLPAGHPACPHGDQLIRLPKPPLDYD